MAYRIVVSAREAGEPHTFDFDRDIVLVGRRAGVDLLLPHPGVGGVHLRLEREGRVVTVVDAGLGTVIDGKRLAAGDRLTLEPDGTRSLARALVRDLLVSFGKAATETAAVIEVEAGPAAGQRVALPPPGQGERLGRHRDPRQLSLRAVRARAAALR